MNFGNKASFMISVELDENPGGSWLFGKFCYWAASKMIGDYETGASLRDVLFQMKYIIGDAGNRFSPELMTLPSAEIFQLILSATRESSQEIFQYINQNVLPAKFDVRIPVDIFNSWDIFLVENENEAELIFRENEENKIEIQKLTPGEFDKIIKQAHAYLEELLKKHE